MDLNLDFEALLKDRRVLLGLGGALALLAGVGIGVGIMVSDKGSSAPPPASRAGLVIETGRADDKMDSTRELRCFVAGQFVGDLTLAQCAERNGVATGSLDVGLDETGALAAADIAGTVLTPLPPPQVAAPAPQPAPPVPAQAASTPAAPSAPIGICWRYAGGWTQAGEMTRGECVRTLFSGQCEHRGGATYGRWGDQTLRLVVGKVEISGDNRRFRTLVEQGPGCSIPPID